MIDEEMRKDAIRGVTSGAAILDAQMPGWERGVDLGTLDIRSTCNCVLGQLFNGSYVDGVRELFLQEEGINAALTTSHRHGFGSPHSLFKGSAESNAWFNELRERWTDLIKERFNTGTFSDS